MVNTRTDAELAAAVQAAVDAMLPQIREQVREEYRTGAVASGSNPPPVTIHTWLERFNKQKPRSFEKAVAPVDAENWISHMEKIFDVMDCNDAFKTRLAVYKFEGDALAWWKAYKQAKGGDAWVLTLTWAAFKELFFLQFFPRAEQERLKREYHSIRQRASENSTEYMQRFLRLAGFLGQAAGTAEEMNSAKTFVGVADAARNLEILRDRDDYDRSERSDKSVDEPISVGPLSRIVTEGHDQKYWTVKGLTCREMVDTQESVVVLLVLASNVAGLVIFSGDLLEGTLVLVRLGHAGHEARYASGRVFALTQDQATLIYQEVFPEVLQDTSYSRWLRFNIEFFSELSLSQKLLIAWHRLEFKRVEGSVTGVVGAMVLFAPSVSPWGVHGSICQEEGRWSERAGHFQDCFSHSLWFIIEFLVMPFGSRMIHCIYDLMTEFFLNLGQFVIVFIDDILVFSKSIKRITRRISATVLRFFRQENYMLKFSKVANFGWSRWHFRVNVSAEGITMESARLSYQPNGPRPMSVDRSTEFFWISRFITADSSGFLSISLTLNSLMRNWCEKVFYSDALRRVLAVVPHAAWELISYALTTAIGPMRLVISRRVYSVDDDGILWQGTKLCVPEDPTLREALMTEAHSSPFSIHPGSTKMYHDLKQHFWWSGMKRDVATFVSKCLICQQVKIEHQRASGLLQPLEIPVWKWDEISMDFVTGLPRTQRKHDAIWVVVDRLTKSAHFLPIRKDYPVSKIAEMFQQEIVRLHGTPSAIVSDRDPRFTSRFWKGLQNDGEPGSSARFGIKGKLSPRFIGPFEILDRVGEVSYRLALPPQLSHVHNIREDSIILEEEPESILDLRTRVMRIQGRSLLSKILWGIIRAGEALGRRRYLEGDWA
ncbi:retrotransposon protein, putative, ty3-gypsy subclass [Tanacetum coccineum]